MKLTINGETFKGAVARELDAAIKRGVEQKAFNIIKLGRKIVCFPRLPQYLLADPFERQYAIVSFIEVDGVWVRVESQEEINVLLGAGPDDV
jgi:hypothetical protein